MIIALLSLGHGEVVELRAHNLTGQLIKSYGEISQKAVLNLTNLEVGAYVLEARGKNFKQSFKLLKN